MSATPGRVSDGILSRMKALGLDKDENSLPIKLNPSLSRVNSISRSARLSVKSDSHSDATNNDNNSNTSNDNDDTQINEISIRGTERIAPTPENKSENHHHYHLHHHNIHRRSIRHLFQSGSVDTHQEHVDSPLVEQERNIRRVDAKRSSTAPPRPPPRRTLSNDDNIAQVSSTDEDKSDTHTIENGRSSGLRSSLSSGDITTKSVQRIPSFSNSPRFSMNPRHSMIENLLQDELSQRLGIKRLPSEGHIIPIPAQVNELNNGNNNNNIITVSNNNIAPPSVNGSKYNQIGGDFVPYVPKRKRKSIDTSTTNQYEVSTDDIDEDFQLDEEQKQLYKTPSEQQVAAAVILQKYTRSWLAKRKYHSIAKRQRHRTSCVMEILTTERQYVHDLKLVTQVYLEPLKRLAASPKPPITRENITQIFSDLEVIMQVNSAFLEKLEARLANISNHTIISDIFLSMAPFFKAYSRYCNNYERSQQVLNEVKRNQDIRQLFYTMDRDGRVTKGNLGSYLILPIQRIPRYRLLLQDLIKQTDEDHPDFSNLKEALNSICNVADHLNGTMKTIDRTNDILKIQSQFTTDISFLEPHRQFLQSGRFWEMESIDNMGNLRETGQVICLHLFNDILVVSNVVGNNEEYQYKTTMKLKNTLLFDYIRFDTKEEQFIFQIKSPIYKAQLKAISLDEKKQWLQKLHETCSEAKRKNRTSVLHITARSLEDGSCTRSIAAALAAEEDYNIAAEDCLKIMKQGATLLKYCTHTKPHFRVIALSSDERFLIWGSPKKSSDKSKVRLSDVSQLLYGQKTPIFEKNLTPELENLSFSLLYSNKSLDLVCKDRREFIIWTTGLEYLRTFASKGGSSPSATLSTDVLDTNRVSVLMGREKKKLKNNFEHIGDAYTWGQGSRGALGHGMEQDQTTPLVVRDFLYVDVASIACENLAGAVVTQTGSLFTYGSGEKGRLGHGDFSDRVRPSLVKGLTGTKTVQVDLGYLHTIALDMLGRVWAFGSSEHGQLGLGSACIGPSAHKTTPTQVPLHDRVRSIACGHWHTGCITVDGSVWIWGRGDDGQLGFGNKETIASPRSLTEIYGFKGQSMALGPWHSLILLEDGQLVSFGSSTYGQLGHGDTDEQLIPKRITFFENKIVVQIAVGSGHSVCLLNTGEVFCWGSGIYGQLGNNQRSNTSIPVLISTLNFVKDPVSSIASGMNHVLCLTQRGKVYAWGAGMYGRLGLNTETDEYIPREVTVLSNRTVRSIAAGGNQSACVCAHQWIPDKDVTACMQCTRPFTFRKRRHHCRYCGGVFCGDCTSKRITILRFGFDQPVRVCDDCHKIIASMGSEQSEVK